LKQIYQPFKKTSALAQKCKETHCITNSFLNHSAVLTSSRFRVGSNVSEAGGSVHPVTEFIQHPLFDYWAIDFDISVVRVSDSALLCLSASQNYL